MKKNERYKNPISIFVEKSILYTKITISQKKVCFKLRPFSFVDPILLQIMISV